MKVYDRSLTGASALETGRAQESQNAGQAGKSAASGAGSSGDRVEFSGTLSRLSHAMATHDSARANRIQALAAQFQSGTYKPDSTATSRGIVSEGLSAGIR
ncbi:MAG TPA: flagellar biosynthesis anti-sigma factor FlgM [Bryobacteraceae bacterium]|nr:flagellar biosynthesis anti-sigma factor FlgM [Bryobacteraceae bacterium]